MARKTKPALIVPQNDDAADLIFAEYASYRNSLARLQALLDEEITATKDEFEAAAKPVKEALQARFGQLEAWAAANRTRLTDDGKVKTVDRASGKLGWRIAPPSIKLTDKVDAVLESLRERRLHRFIRETPSINKERLLEEREKLKDTEIPGIVFVSDVEAFFVEPHGLELAQVKP